MFYTVKSVLMHVGARCWLNLVRAAPREIYEVYAEHGGFIDCLYDPQ